jgi:hypothetical protein
MPYGFPREWRETCWVAIFVVMRRSFQNIIADDGQTMDEWLDGVPAWWAVYKIHV